MENNEVRSGQKWGIWLFLIYTMVTLLLCLLFFFMLKVPFSSDADYLQAGITGGAMGTGADQTAQYYLSALLTTALARAGAELDIFNIYSVFLMGLCFLTFTAMHWLVTKRADTILFHLVIFAFMICALLEFNYLTIAFLAAGSGILSVFGIRGSDHIVSRLFSWLLGILLIAGGCGLRLFVLPAAILLLLTAAYFLWERPPEIAETPAEPEPATIIQEPMPEPSPTSRPAGVIPFPDIPETRTHPAKASASAIIFLRLSFSRKKSTDISIIQIGEV